MFHFSISFFFPRVISCLAVVIMSSTAKSECLLRRDARLYCQKRNQRIMWQTWRDERRSNDSLERELKHLERSRSLKSRAMDREQGRFLESLVDIFQRQCDIASDRLEKSSVEPQNVGLLQEEHGEKVPTSLSYERHRVLPAIEEGFEGLSTLTGAITSSIDDGVTSLEDSGDRVPPAGIIPFAERNVSPPARKFTHTAPPISKVPADTVQRDRKLVTADGLIGQESGLNFSSDHGEDTGITGSKRKSLTPSENRQTPRTFYTLRRMANISRQRNKDVENFRRQFLVNALATHLHISALRSQNFAGNDDIRKKIERKKRCLSELKRGRCGRKSNNSRISDI